ncbi:hypothetical protein RDI58_004662 [Solanum bulbocastanum]|uniref:Uncharacterized protein n=1 Tax=Solanum bulbocastanum TaxID=147425 RepID=A0AAN8YLU8_SOLBU
MHNIDENHEEKERENPILLVEPIPNEDCKVNSGMELGTSEVEYIESENLKDVEDVDMSLKNPRSAVCKTAIMTSADIFKAYCDSVVASIDPLLVQLLLKSSQGKRFVCEAAEKALISMTTWISPFLLLPKLQPYLKNKNPQIRGFNVHFSKCTTSGS